MSRTVKGRKLPGFEYWSRRPGNSYGLSAPAKLAKRIAHRGERAEGKQQCKEVSDDRS